MPRPLRELFWRPPPETKPEPRAIEATISGNPKTYMNQRARDTDFLKKCKVIREQGGMVSEAIDAYPLYCMTNGYTFEGEDDNLIEDVQNWAESWDMDTSIGNLISDAICYKWGFAEIVPSKGGGIYGLKSLDSVMCEPVTDQYGKLISVKVFQDSFYSKYIELKADEVVTFEWSWLLQRAYDDIMRDVRVIEGISESIERHGFPKYHVAVGQPGEKIGQSGLDKISSLFRKLKPNMDMTTVADVKIQNIDQNGTANTSEYSNLFVQRVCSALGVPEEMLGLGRGSTEATANVRLQAFYGKIGALQKAVARCINSQVIDLYTGRPGRVKLTFRDVSPYDEKLNADMILGLMSVSPVDPELIITRSEARERLNMGEHPDDQEGAEPKPQTDEELPPEVIR